MAVCIDRWRTRIPNGGSRLNSAKYAVQAMKDIGRLVECYGLALDRAKIKDAVPKCLIVGRRKKADV